MQACRGDLREPSSNSSRILFKSHTTRDPFTVLSLPNISCIRFILLCIVSDYRRHGAAGQPAKMEQGERAPVGAECARIHQEFLQQEDRRTADKRLDAEGQVSFCHISELNSVVETDSLNPFPGLLLSLNDDLASAFLKKKI
jgi:hypothetical protein